MTATNEATKRFVQATSHIGHNLLQWLHGSFALLGLLTMVMVVTFLTRPDLRQAGELSLMGWLQHRIAQVAEADSMQAPAAQPSPEYKRQARAEAALAAWLSRKYSVAPEPIGQLVAAAFEVGRRSQVDPTLVLAVIAVESGFNPFAQSSFGAQGLMQVMTKVHGEKYVAFGGQMAAFDPIANLRVGVEVLRDCIHRGGSVERGLKLYVGAGNLADDGGYVAKVQAEQGRLLAIASGRALPAQRPSAVLAGGAESVSSRERALASPDAAPSNS